jgi:hypothetical protein
MKVLKTHKPIIEQYISEHQLLFKELYPGDFTFTKTKKDGSTSIQSSPFINFHHPTHLFEDIHLFGAPQYFSAEPYEHKIKHLKIVTKLTNFKNPSNDIALADFYKNLELWQRPFADLTTKLEVFWRKSRVYDYLCPFGVKYYHWNSVVLTNRVKLEQEAFISLKNGQVIKILELWCLKECISDSSILLKVQLFTDLLPVPFFPIWEQAEPTHISTISILDIEKRICGWEINPTLFYFHKYFKVE